MKGKRVQQINNLTIREGEFGYSVWTPDGRCWEDRLSLEDARKFCKKTKDFCKR